MGILIIRIKTKLRAVNKSRLLKGSYGYFNYPNQNEIESCEKEFGHRAEILVEEIVALKETAHTEMKEDDQSVKGNFPFTLWSEAEKEKAKTTDMRLKVLEKVSEKMKRHSNENDQEKVKKRERRSGSETMLFLFKKEENDQELKLEELKLKKEQHDLDAKRLQTSIDQQQQSEIMRLMQEQQQQQQLLASQQRMLRQQQDQTKAVMGLLDKLVNKWPPNSFLSIAGITVVWFLNCAVIYVVTIHPDKTEIMLITSKDFIGPLRPIKLGDHEISFVNESHCLGFTIDNKLSWGCHIKVLTTSMTKKVKLLRSFKSFPFQILEPIYFKGILPSVTYGISVWGNCSEAKLDGLEKIHLSAAKLIFKQQIPPSWKSLSYFYKKRLYCLTHKAYYGFCPEQVATIIKKSRNLRNMRDNFKLTLDRPN